MRCRGLQLAADRTSASRQRSRHWQLKKNSASTNVGACGITTNPRSVTGGGKNASRTRNSRNNKPIAKRNQSRLVSGGRWRNKPSVPKIATIGIR